MIKDFLLENSMNPSVLNVLIFIIANLADNINLIIRFFYNPLNLRKM